MKTASYVTENTRRALLLALATVAAVMALVLAGCSSGGSTTSESSDTAETTATETAESTATETESSTESTAASTEAETATEASSTEIDAAAYDKLIASGITADDETIAASKWASAIKEAGKMRVGTTRTSTLFSLENEVDGTIRGFDAGLYQLLARYILGDENAVEVTQVTSDTRESVLQNDQVDAVFATYTITDERSKLISFAGPYYTSKYSILVTEDNSDINGLDDLAGKNVAVQSGSTGPTVMEEYAPEAVLQQFSTDEEARTALEQGRVDAYVFDYSMNLGSIVKNPGKYKVVGDTFGPDDPYGIGLPLDSDGVQFVNDFLTKIEQDGTWAELWKISIGDRTNVDTAPEPPALN